MNIGILIQARMNSSRLPGKALLALGGKPALQQMVERLRRVPGIPVIVATSSEPADDAIASLCAGCDFDYVRGDLDDVRTRFRLAAEKYQLEVMVRITGDSPLIDPGVVTKMISSFQSNHYDYYSNLRPRTMPRGFGCEIFRRDLLDKAIADRQAADHGEYVVVPYVNRHEKELAIGNFRMTEDRSALRLTMDEPADYELIQKIYNALYEKNPEFTYHDILSFLDARPDLKTR